MPFIMGINQPMVKQLDHLEIEMAEEVSACLQSYMYIVCAYPMACLCVCALCSCGARVHVFDCV